jgi:glycerophosphoryl diester phosphodiesterase
MVSRAVTGGKPILLSSTPKFKVFFWYFGSKLVTAVRIRSVTSIFAHRGHHVTAPENSVAAVAAARDIGADGVEIDVWLTRDKFLVVNHDRSLHGRSLPSSTLGEVSRALSVAQLGEVLAAAGEMRINVEIKSTRSLPYNLLVARAVGEALDAAPESPRCLVSSFSLAICDEVRRLFPERRVGWLVHRRSADSILDQVVRSKLTSAHFPFSRVNAAVAQRARDLGVELHVWTPNLRRDIERMLDFAVGSLITDDVALAQDLRATHRAATDE